MAKEPGNLHHIARISKRFAIFCLGATLAACALEPLDDGGIKSAVSPLRVTTQVPEASAFVRESRPAQGAQYIPVGVTPPASAAPKRSAAEVQQLEAELAAQKAKSQGYARRAAPAPTYDGKPAPKVAPPPKELMSDEN